LVKKREKCKLQRVKILKELFELQTNPLQHALQMAFDFLQKEDKYGFFYAEVSKELFPEYYKMIQRPISFVTIQSNINLAKYRSFAEFLSDIHLLCSNAMMFNDPTHMIHKEAKRIRKLSDEISKASHSEEESAKDLENNEVKKPTEQPSNHPEQHSKEQLEDAIIKRLPERKVKRTGTVPVRVPSSSVPVQVNVKSSSLQQILRILLKRLEQIDSMQLFAKEISSGKIPRDPSMDRKPSCFSMIRRKLEARKYPRFQLFWDDFRFLCNHALAYHRPGTVGFREAKRLLFIGEKLLEHYKDGRSLEKTPSICSLCEEVNTRASKMLRCGSCEKIFHLSCLLPPLNKIPKGEWFCGQCDPSKHCNVCLSEEDDERILLCDGCDAGFHIYCIDPAMKRIPKGKWFCGSCSSLLEATSFTCQDGIPSSKQGNGDTHLASRRNPIRKTESLLKKMKKERNLKQRTFPRKWERYETISDTANELPLLSSSSSLEEEEEEEEISKHDLEEEESAGIEETRLELKMTKDVAVTIAHGRKEMHSNVPSDPGRDCHGKRVWTFEPKLAGACPEHRRRKKRCPEDCVGRIALRRKHLRASDGKLAELIELKKKSAGALSREGAQTQGDVEQQLTDLSASHKRMGSVWPCKLRPKLASVGICSASGLKRRYAVAFTTRRRSGR